MSKGRFIALCILALLMVVLIFNTKGDVKIDLLFTDANPIKAIAFLCFTSVGVIVGILLK